MSPPVLLTRKEVAKRLNVSITTLSKPRWIRTGPPFVRLSGNLVGYPSDLLDDWIASRPRGGAGSEPAEQAAA